MKPSRYNIAVGTEAELEPGSRGMALRNKLGIKTVSAMEIAESNSLFNAQLNYYLNGKLLDATITSGFISKMHYDWLGGMYNWAGRYRTVELSKGGFSWPAALLVPENMRNFDATLSKYTPLTEMELRDACSAVA